MITEERSLVQRLAELIEKLDQDLTARKKSNQSDGGKIMKYEFKSTTNQENNNKIVIYRSGLYDRKEITIRIINYENSEACDLTIQDARKLSKALLDLLKDYDLPVRGYNLDKRKKALKKKKRPVA